MGACVMLAGLYRCYRETACLSLFSIYGCLVALPSAQLTWKALFLSPLEEVGALYLLPSPAHRQRPDMPTLFCLYTPYTSSDSWPEINVQFGNSSQNTTVERAVSPHVLWEL